MKKCVILFEFSILRRIHFTYSAIAGKKANNPRFHLMLQSENSAKKSTIFHVVSNM